MHYTKDERNYIIVLERGEDAFEKLQSFCQKENIKNAYFRGIGAVEHLECGYYALHEQAYHFTTYDELLEVASLTGNVMLKDDEPFLHIHGIFTDTTNNAFGGHVKAMRVGVTLEIILSPLKTALERKLDESIGLALISCPQHEQ